MTNKDADIVKIQVTFELTCVIGDEILKKYLLDFTKQKSKRFARDLVNSVPRCVVVFDLKETK